MISISNLDFHFGSRTLYDGADLHIKPKDKIGLVGLNGTGKSTLLRLLVGEYRPDGGSISMSKEVTLGFLNQDLLSYDSHEPIMIVAMQAFEEALKLQKQIDEVLTTYSHGWSLDRMAAVDRAALRLGTWEVVWNDEVPDAVAIAEAVSLVEALSTDDSPKFVNGLLARVAEVKPTLV